MNENITEELKKAFRNSSFEMGAKRDVIEGYNRMLPGRLHHYIGIAGITFEISAESFEKIVSELRELNLLTQEAGFRVDMPKEK